MIKLPQLPEGREMRLQTAPPTIEYRVANGEAQQPEAFVGQAIVCGVRSNVLGGPGFRFVEIIDASALNEADISNVEGVFNHNSDCLLGHTRSGTLELTRTQDGGLSYRIAYDGSDPDHQRVMRKIERGDVVGSSFMFTASDSDWTNEQTPDGGDLYVRTVRKIDRVYDVCPVTSPAYSDATAAKRSLDSYQQEHPAPPAPHETDHAMRARELELAAY
jgi:HK97 family phage prohead protease